MQEQLRPLLRGVSDADRVFVGVIAAGPHLVLIGMMGVGKTTVGRLLARRLGWEYVDTDVLVVETAGRTVAEIFEVDGEAAFRAAETAALQKALASQEHTVVSIGGGAVLAEQNQELMKSTSTVVWLRATERTILSRVGSGEGRPMLVGGTAMRVRGLNTTRGPIYSQLADSVVDVDRITPLQVTQRIVEQLELEG